MAQRSSRELSNPAIGMRGTIRKTGGETDGELFEIVRDWWGAANEGSRRKWGAPSFVELAAIQREYPDEFSYLSAPPVGLQRATFALLAPLGRRRLRSSRTA